MKRILLFLISLIFISISSIAQKPDVKPIRWTVNVKMNSASEGVAIFKASIDPGWHLYGFNLPDGGPKSTVIDLAESKGVKFIGGIVPDNKPVTIHDAMFDLDLTMWEKDITFRQKFKVTDAAKAVIAGKIEFMGCNDATCLPPSTEKFSKPVKK